jgi:3-isopropylmalate dehydrogenase
MPAHGHRIAVFPGDGIGPEVIEPTIEILKLLESRVGGFHLIFDHHEAGAQYYRKTGLDISPQAFEAARAADAILLGAMGLPDVRFPDGTEIAPHLKMRDAFGLYSGVRPVKAFSNTPRRLLDPRAANIDLIILRESTEGLFFSHGRGEVTDTEARETLRITRATTEKLCDTAFKLARRRKGRGGQGRVTCVDKSNVFRAYAFFRKIFRERASLYPDIEATYAYVDAMALDLVRRPWDFDVLVMENMFGDILSDLGGGLVGGMGMAPCAEIGDEHGLFQPAHGTAPDIAGQGKANPTAAFLSAAMMLDWLGERHAVPAMSQAAEILETSIADVFDAGRLQPMEFGGAQGCRDVTKVIFDTIQIKAPGRDSPEPTTMA